MNANQNTLYKIYSTIGRILAIICVAASAFVLKSNVDENGYLAKSPLSAVWVLLIVGSVIFALSALFTMKNASKLGFNRPAAGYLSPFSALGMAISLIFVFKDNGVGIPSWLLITLGIIAASYIVQVDFKFIKNDILEICFGLATVIFCGLVIAEIYMDPAEKIISVAKTVPAFAAASIMLNTLSTLRYHFSAERDGFTVFTNVSASIICPIAFMTGFLGNQAPSIGFIPALSPFSYFFLGYAIFAISRLCSLCQREEDAKIAEKEQDIPAQQ